MKKIIFLLLLLPNILFAQRTYTGCQYMKYNYGEKKFSDVKVQIKWDNDDATNVDNITYIMYPDGYVVPYTNLEFQGNDNSGNPYWKFTAQDEGKRDVTCYIVKYNKRDISVSIFYSKNLYYSLLINLFNVEN